MIINPLFEHIPLPKGQKLQHLTKGKNIKAISPLPLSIRSGVKLTDSALHLLKKQTGTSSLYKA